MKTKQTIITALLAITLMMIAATAFAQTPNPPSDFTFTQTATAVTITGYTGTSKTVVIPAQINGKPVTTIGTSAFRDKQLTGVTIPNGVTAIRMQAFQGNQLTGVTIPDSVTTIGDGAFARNQLTSVTIGNSVTSIGVSAFRENKLTGVTIPDSVTTMGSMAFLGNQLAGVTIPDSVTTMGSMAFLGNQLTSVSIGANVALGTNLVANNNLLKDVYDNGGKQVGAYVFHLSKWVYGSSAPDILTTSLPNQVIGNTAAHNQILVAVGAMPMTWTITGGSLPTGLTLNQMTGLISGTPAATGIFNFTVRAENSLGYDTKTISITIRERPPSTLRGSYLHPGTGITYNGFAGTEGIRTSAGGITLVYPSETTFSADGFFTLEGIIDAPSVENIALITVRKNGESGTETQYNPEGNFETRIWFRHGAGAYTVRVYDYIAGNDGVITGVGNPITYNVTNTRDEDGRFIYPSYCAQSDAPLITNLAAELTAGLLNDTDKIKAIYDYINLNTRYGVREGTKEGIAGAQDALAILGTRYNGYYLAICEGYTHVFAAIARAAGFQTKIIESIPPIHAWNHVLVNGVWKFIDVTEDASLTYRNFLLDDFRGTMPVHRNWQVDSNNQ